MSARPVVIMAGGTGGHIFPGIAVARALSVRGVPVRWIGSAGGLETRLVPEAGIAIDTLAIGGIRGKGLKALLAAPWRLMQAVLAARRILKAAKAAAVISFGGFAAGPGGLAARWLGIPVFVHEQNSIAGLTNKVLARLARNVFTGFSAVRGLHGVWTGNPVRADIAALPAPEQRPRPPGLRLLVLGGSQGARALNQVLPETIRSLQIPNLDVRHQCGARMLDAARAAYGNAGVRASVEPFIADMAEAYAWADLVVCRAGALTLAELCAAGVGAVLIPYPHAVDDHQTANARALLDAGAAVLLPEKDLNPSTLFGVLQPLLADPARRLAMARAARSLAKPDADQVVADMILKEAA
ncbi:undecaprenyldiphospho-muramoylpentapeptide beta-N-acetylglucosaminyltransferase [Ahniella affigens]|uniref:UDP-N-acetylglucosamine--N-acetylmuramyl-(pentapeptide) pyrophosphoryl-undecaprenol N-acetylglucosamine transferase n=1 Tax=Ahniella affigens TaxID=2021234 RepID=A0A2P1PM62_9GAMM|nr:undecaprenyldiphospho-muramoylpentapeptide beta-N-acetylglucosaminyltransferase [Ahniella affigens]